MVPVDPNGFAAGARDDAQPHAGVGGAGARIAELHRLRGGVLRVGDEVLFHTGAVGFLVDQELTVGGPPAAIQPVQLLGRCEFGQAVRDYVRAAGGQARVVAGGQVHDVQIIVTHRGHGAAIRRQARRDPACPRYRLLRGIRQIDRGELVGLGDQDPVAILAQREIGNASQCHAGPLTARLFLYAEVLGSGGQRQSTLLVGLELVLVKTQMGVAWAAAQIQHGLAVRRRHCMGRLAQRETPRGGQRLKAGLVCTGRIARQTNEGRTGQQIDRQHGQSTVSS